MGYCKTLNSLIKGLSVLLYYVQTKNQIMEKSSLENIMRELIRELFFNATILVSFIALSNELYREKIATTSSSMYQKVLTGLFAGLLGCLLMVFSVNVTADIYLDLRNLPIIMMALYTTFPSALVSSLVIGIFRMTYFGVNQSSVTAFVAAVAIGIGCGLIGKLNLKRQMKWILSDLMVFIITGIVYAILIKNPLLLKDVIIVNCGGTAVASFFLYFLLENISETNKMWSQVNEDAKKDFLTGLYNVRQFDALLNRAIKEAKQRHENLSFLFIDIDYFKKVNDTYGHTEGDFVLKQLSDILKNSCRSYDIISRNGGEEFSVILPGCSMEQAIELAERIRRNIEQYDFILSFNQKIKITVSIGVSSYLESDAEKLVEHADMALYRAKREGRNVVKSMKIE